MDFLRRNNNRRNNHRRSHHDKEEYNSQGGDDEGDDDDDDDAVIVYKEATTTNWAHSQISMASTRSKQRRQKQKQQQHDEEEEQQQQQENDQKNQENNEQVSAIISRKRSGRRNRSCRPFHSREREQHLFNNDYEEPASVEEDDNRDNNSDDDDDNVDAFASLRPMMVQLSQEQKMGLSQQQQQQQEKSDDDDDDDDGQSEKTETIQHGEDNNHTEEVSLGRGSSRCIDSGGGGLYGLNLNIQSKVSKINTKKTPLPPSLEKENTNELRAVGQDSDRKSVPILNNNNNNRIRHNKSLLPVEIDGNDDRSTKKLRALSPVELNHVVCSPPDFDICDDSNDHDDDNDDDDNSTESIFPYRLRGSKDHDHNSLLSTTRNSTRPSMTNSMSMNQNKKRSSSDRSNNNIKEKRQRKQKALLRNNNSSDRTGRVDIDAACGSKRRDQRVDTNSSTTTTTKRRLRQDTKVSSSATATATVTTTTTSTASRTHRIKRIDKSSRNQHCSSTTLTSEKKIKLQKPSRPKAPTDVENVKKSIVGVRPTHWSRNPREDQNKRMISKGKKSLHQLAKPSALAAATRTPFKLTKTIGKEKKKNAVSNIHSNNNAPSSKNEIDVTTTENNNTTRSPDGEMKISSFSFAPSFVPTKSIASVAASLIDDTVGDDSGDECRLVTSNRLVLTGTNTSNILSPPYAKRRRSNKTVTGEWGRRLIALRNSRANDSVRLQNQAFARRRMFDVNDPRKRAKTFTDVTIMGSYNGPWINRPEDMKITILGYVHRHIQKNNNSYTKGNNQLHDQCHHHHQQQLLQQEADNIFSQDYFAWFTFTLATARCINLERACKLRIYNAIILRCRMPTRLDLPPKSFGGSNSKNIIRCEKIVICTHLCERTDGTASSS